MKELFQLLEIKHIAFGVGICMIRIMSLLAVASFFSKQYIGGVARKVCVFSLSIILLPLVYPTLHDAPNEFIPYLVIIFKEAFLGSIMGFLVNFIFFVSQSVGFLIDIQRGASMASIFDPMSGSQTSPLGSLFLRIVVTLFFSTGAIYFFLDVVYSSYIVWPVFEFFPDFKNLLPEFFLKKFADDFMIQLGSLVGPVLFVLFLTEFGLGLVTRFAPQLNVFFLSMPIKSALAMFFIILYMNFLLEFFKKKFIEGDKLILFFQSFFK